jgi:threonine dehydrogenase-like Zn-dependent dehydrogenase
VTAFYYSLAAPFSLQKIEDNEAFRPDVLQVRTLYSAISPGTELAAFNGLPPLRETARPYPRLVGYCNVGEITYVPGAVSDYAVGDIVLTHASHRTHYGVTATEVLARVPKGADLPAAATTYLFHLGYAAALKGDIRAGHKVAVIGLGTLGLTSACLSRTCGAQVTGYSSHVQFDDTLQAFGLDRVLEKSQSVGGDFDVAITTSNAWSDWQLALNLVRRGGQIVVLGFPGRGEPAPDFNPLASQWLYDKQLTITSCGHTPDVDVDPIDLRFTLPRNCDYLMKEILHGRLPARSLISEIRPAEELDDIYPELSRDRRQGRTVVLDWRSTG